MGFREKSEDLKNILSNKDLFIEKVSEIGIDKFMEVHSISRMTVYSYFKKLGIDTKKDIRKKFIYDNTKTLREQVTEIFNNRPLTVGKVDYFKNKFPEIWGKIIQFAYKPIIDNYPEEALIYSIINPEKFEPIFCQYSGDLRRYRVNDGELTSCSRECQCFKDQTVIRLRKAGQTNLITYGDSSLFKTKHFKVEADKTNSTYEGGHPSRDPEVKAKVDATHFKKCGMKRVSQLPEMISQIKETQENNRPSLKILRNKELLSEFIKDKTLQEAAKLLGFGLGTIRKEVKKFGISEYKRVMIKKYEEEIKSFLDGLNINYQKDNRKQLKGKELDFWFPEHNFAIECQGDFHHMNPNKYQAGDINDLSKFTAQEIWDNDLYKLNLCKQKGIDLFYIWQSEWKENPEKFKKYITERLSFQVKVL